MGLLEETLRGKSLADYTNTQLRLALGAVLYTNTADMWKKYLNQIGYTGDVSQMLQKYYVDYSVPSNFRNYINAGASIFNPQNMFAADAGEQGYVYDLNDLSTLYLESTALTSASVNGLVGLVLDKKNGLSVGSELTTNGDFSGGASGWSPIGSLITITGGALVISGAANNSGYFQGLAGYSGGVYEITVVVSSISAGAVTATLGIPSPNGSNCFNMTSAGTYTFRQGNLTGDTNLRVYSVGASTTATIDSVSVKQIAGNHAYQSTTGNKPVLRGSPIGANLVTNGDFASGTGWTTGAGWAIGSGVATATASSGTLTSTLTATIAKVYRLTYTITASAGSIQPSFGGVSGASRSAAGTYVEYLTASSTAALVFTGTTFSGTVDNVEVVDVSAGSVQAPYALQFDGVDDFLQTASVNFTATDKMTVCHGVRKLSDAALGVVVELSVDPGSNNGAFAIYAPQQAGVANYGATVRGTATGFFGTPASYPSTSTGVVSLVANILTGQAVRVNGTQVATSGAAGTGNFGNYPLYFGRRGGTTLPFNGLDFGGVIVNKTPTATQLTACEKWVASRTGVSF